MGDRYLFLQEMDFRLYSQKSGRFTILDAFYYIYLSLAHICDHMYGENVFFQISLPIFKNTISEYLPIHKRLGAYCVKLFYFSQGGRARELHY